MFFDIPAGPTAEGADPVAFSSSGVIRVQTLHDLDAEDEKFTLMFSRPDGIWRPRGRGCRWCHAHRNWMDDQPEGLTLDRGRRNPVLRPDRG